MFAPHRLVVAIVALGIGLVFLVHGPFLHRSQAHTGQQPAPHERGLRGSAPPQPPPRQLQDDYVIFMANNKNNNADPEVSRLAQDEVDFVANETRKAHKQLSGMMPGGRAPPV